MFVLLVCNFIMMLSFETDQVVCIPVYAGELRGAGSGELITSRIQAVHTRSLHVVFSHRTIKTT